MVSVDKELMSRLQRDTMDSTYSWILYLKFIFSCYMDRFIENEFKIEL